MYNTPYGVILLSLLRARSVDNELEHEFNARSNVHLGSLAGCEF